MSEPAVIHEQSNGIHTMRLNRPDALNAMNGALMQGIIDTTAAVANDPDAKALIITGTGRGFCAGADLQDGVASEGKSPGERTRNSMLRVFNPAVNGIYDLDVPVICAVNGVAAGGGAGLALVGDLVIAARSAKFIQVFVPNLGLVPDVSSTWNLPRRVGRSRALGLAMLGEPLSAEQAEEWGMIWQCVDDDALMDTAMQLAERVAASPTGAFRATRHLLDAALGHDLAQQLAAEADAQKIRANSKDFAEGIMAFREKRKPKFTGE